MIRASCRCTRVPPMPREDGVLACGACGAPYVAEATTSGALFTTSRLPPDAKNADHFNRQCRAGLVSGAYKLGRDWFCTVEAWRARARAPRPRGLPPKKPRAVVQSTPISSEDALLAELGATRKRTG